MSFNPNSIFETFNNKNIDNETTYSLIKDCLESIQIETYNIDDFKKLYKKFKINGCLGPDYKNNYEVRNLFIKRMLAHAKKLDIK